MSLINLRPNETVGIFGVETRTQGVYYADLWALGSSILSTLFVETVAPGATILVEFQDIGLSDLPSDVVPLGSHRLIDESDVADKTTITRFHSKPRIKVTISGGSVRFGLWATLKTEHVPDVAINAGSTEVYTGTMTPGVIQSFPPVADKPIQQLSVRCATDQSNSHRLKVSIDNQANWITLSPGEIFGIVPRGDIRQIYLDGLTNQTMFEVILLMGA